MCNCFETLLNNIAVATSFKMISQVDGKVSPKYPEFCLFIDLILDVASWKPAQGNEFWFSHQLLTKLVSMIPEHCEPSYLSNIFERLYLSIITNLQIDLEGKNNYQILFILLRRYKQNFTSFYQLCRVKYFFNSDIKAHNTIIHISSYMNRTIFWTDSSVCN